MKKLLIISNYDDLSNPYYSGGGSRVIHDTAKRLMPFYKIEVLTGKYPGSKDEIVDSVRYKRVGFKFGGPKIGQLIYQLVLPYYVLTIDFDIWIESFTPPFSTGMLQFFTTKPVIGLAHMLSGKDMRRKYKLPFDLIESLGLKTYKYFIVTSKLIEETITKYNSSALKVIIPNSIDEEALSKKFKKKYILYIGRIEINQKGLDLLIDAFTKLPMGNTYKLAIAGSGEKSQVKILKNLIDKKKIKQKVILLGKVEGNNKKRILEQAICMVVPSRFETFSMSSLEAMFFGIPLVTFDIDGLKWIPSICRLKNKNFDTHEMSNNIQKILINSQLREKLIFEGQKFTKKYNWTFAMQKYQLFLNSILYK